MPIDRSSQGRALERQVERPRLPDTSRHWSLQAAQQEDWGTIALRQEPWISLLAATEQFDQLFARGGWVELPGAPDMLVEKMPGQPEGVAQIIRRGVAPGV